jgi:hypothetical protein
VPTRKQRRRQQKLRRHEWEEVYLDEEGNEVEPPPDEEQPRRETRRAATRQAPRGVQPPSWRRVGKRALIFAPLMFVVIAILEPGLPLYAKVWNSLFLVLLFLPFSYLVDAMTYRVWRKRLEREGGRPVAKSR